MLGGQTHGWGEGLCTQWTWWHARTEGPEESARTRGREWDTGCVLKKVLSLGHPQVQTPRSHCVCRSLMMSWREGRADRGGPGGLRLGRGDAHCPGGEGGASEVGAAGKGAHVQRLSRTSGTITWVSCPGSIWRAWWDFLRTWGTQGDVSCSSQHPIFLPPSSSSRSPSKHKGICLHARGRVTVGCVNVSLVPRGHLSLSFLSPISVSTSLPPFSERKSWPGQLLSDCTCGTVCLS